MLLQNNNYIIGVDGGGTKTVAALANLKGKILAKSKTGPSHFIKAGLEETILNITEVIEKVMTLLTSSQKREIVSTFVGLTAIEENKEMGQKIKKLLSQQPKISGIFKGKVIVGSDQIVAFRSGTDEKEGVVLISGAGCAAHGWRGKKEAKTSGWGYFNDEGSGFWIGQEAYRAVYKDLDERGPKTLITKLVFRKLKLKNIEDLKKKVFNECYKVLKNGRFMAINIGTVVSNDGMKFIVGDFVNKCREVGFNFRKDIIWHKPRGTTKWQRGATQFSQKPYPLMFNTNINHEFILIFQKGETPNIDFSKMPKFNRPFIRETAYSVWDIKPVTSPKKDEKHVAPFPVELPRKLIQLFTCKGDTVLDPFAGSGTTNKAARELGRKSIAIELSEKYCKLIEKKIESVKFDSFDKEKIYNSSPEYELKILKEKVDKSYNDYLKIKKEYEKKLRKTSQKPLFK